MLDPSSWYREESNPLRLLINAIRNLDSSIRPDVILVDSRTGISPIAAPLLFDIADIAILTFFPHQQAQDGTRHLARAILHAHSNRLDKQGQPLTPEPRFLISPLPSTPEIFETLLARAHDWIDDWISPARDSSGHKPLAVEEITHAVSYTEVTASMDRISSESNVDPYNEVAGWIAGFVESFEISSADRTEDDQLGPSKVELLNSISFEGQMAENQDVEALGASLVNTAAVTTALKQKTLLVIGRKGTGKTLIFRYILSDESMKTVVITGPAGLADVPNKLPLDAGVFEAIQNGLSGGDESWTREWLSILVLSLVRNRLMILPESAPTLAACESQSSYSGLDLVADVRALVSMADSRLVLQTWLEEADRVQESPVTLLFDGLDTGFDTNAELRNKVVTSLLILANTLGREFQGLNFKIFVREDIYQGLTFPNKSHLRANAALLLWNDRMDFLRLIVHRAIQSISYHEHVRDLLIQAAGARAPFDVSTPIEYWPNEQLLIVWRALVGERMSGGKTAFTDKWVWTRLADANDDHAPRHLMRLFESAREREMHVEEGNPYSRALIRPKSLVDALDQVSVDAVDAIREEFPELTALMKVLESVATTPFDGEALSSAHQAHELELSDLQIKLATEVGLLEAGVVVGERYRVPELYRKALNMNRRGQQ